MKAYDRRRTAIHEAGHAVIAMHLGVAVAGVYISPSRAKDLLSEKSYIGQTVFGSSADDNQYRLICVAGAVAEHVWIARGAPHEYWFDELSEPHSMSPTDWAGTGCEPGEPDEALIDAAEAVEDLLRGELRPSLIALARKLIEAESRGTEDAVLSVAAMLGHNTADRRAVDFR